MWVAKFRVKHDCLLAERCRKFGLAIETIILNHYTTAGRKYVMGIILVHGDKAQSRKFGESLAKDPATRELEWINDNAVSFLFESKEGRQLNYYFEPSMFFIRPVYINRQGWEDWEIASWEREGIGKYIEKARKHADADGFELLKFTQERLSKFHYLNAMPGLTDVQQRVFDAALRSGYYEYPRKIHLRRLAKNLKLSLATVQEHLRKAEAKLLAAK